ncbi:glycosyl transferase, group 1 [Desulfovibrio sp. DV]|nr:glycosyl transferase, group 1 [Desulfovibrio sp. DV]
MGYFLRTFPVLSETFVSAEIRAIAAVTSQPPVVAAMFRPGPGQAGSLKAVGRGRLLYWRDIDKKQIPCLAYALAGLLARRPGAASDALWRSRPGLALQDRLRAVGLAHFFRAHGVTHLHSHFGWEQADVLAHLRRLAGLPYSLTLHAADIFVDPAHLARRLADAAFVATISAFNKHLLVERFGIAPGRIHVVHCGVDVATIDPAPAARPPVPRIFALGRMVPKKGFDVLLQALARLRSQGQAVTAELAGDGPLRPQLMRLAGELGLAQSVFFPGALPHEEAMRRMRDASAVVLACQIAPDGDMDGIPVVLMEAMALGRPVVSTRLSGIPELVAEGCGLLADPGDSASLAEALRQVLGNPSLAASLAAAARCQVERRFTLEGQARRILQLALGHPEGKAA